MRTSREETIRQYAEEYLAGRSEEQRQEFFSKPIARQYSNIMAWRRRNDKRQAAPADAEALSVAAVIKHAQTLPQLIDMTVTMSAQEMQAMQEAADAIKRTLDNYYRVRNTRELQALKQQQEAIQRRIDQLRYEGADE
ncbi:MAG: hypothetical protein K2O78_06985 [Muribaculaceae bacterium]|nr:hypothetical protein [Muribaculaceae bacterium]